MTWPVFQFDQQNLQGLSKTWPVHACEYHTENILFGFNDILRAYASLPPHQPLPWAMEHAIMFDNPKPKSTDVASRMPIILSVTQGQADVLAPHTSARVIPIGSAFFYMQQLHRERFPDSSRGERRGTLVFPDKSVIHKDVDYDRKTFAEALAALPDEFQPVAVSIFWKDYLRGMHRPFEEAGLMLVTSGYSYDPAFLFRQYDLCRQFKYALANDISTSFCLSVLSGCRFIYRPTGALTIREDGKTVAHAQEPSLRLPGKQACIAASPYPPDSDNLRQRELAEYYSGLRHVRPPAFFAELFEEGRHALQSRPVKTAGFHAGTRLDDIAGWLPAGVDAGGWSYDRIGVTAPPHLAAPSVRLHLQIPYRAMRGRSRTLRVEVGGTRTQEFAVRPGFWTLDIPVRAGQATSVSLEWPALRGAVPASRGMRLFQISACADMLASVRFQRQAFRTWARTIEHARAAPLLKRMAISLGGDILRWARGQPVPGRRELPLSGSDRATATASLSP